MMRTKITLSVLAIGLILPMSSCKKGENDPATMKSRTSRLAGTWTLSTNTRTDIYTSAGLNTTSTDVTTDDGVNQNWYLLLDNGTTVDTVSGPVMTTHSLTVAFDKEGGYTMTDILNGNSTVTKGYWYWSGKNKANGISKKEAIILTTLEVNDGSIDTYGGTAQTGDGTWMIDRLAKDELTVITNESITFASGDFWSLDQTMTFTKQ